MTPRFGDTTAGERHFARQTIVVVINSIGTGGAERALDTILRAGGNRLDRYDIRLVLLDRELERRVLPPLGRRYCLDARGSLVRSTVRLDRLLRRIRPALVVSLLVRANMAAAVAGRRAGAATVLCERMHLGSHLDGRYSGAKRAILRLLPRLLYRRADVVLGVSEGVRRDLVDGFGVPEAITRTIYNPYDLEAIGAAALPDPAIALPDRYIVAVGRFVEAKGFADLIDAYAEAQPSDPLVILGDGPERASLERRVARLGLTARVLMPGFLPDPFPVMARASFLASASRNEGFPNAIAEAMALGRPILSTDCRSGPAELLGGTAGRPGTVSEARHGLLVPERDVAALAAGLRMLADPELRHRLGASARTRMEDFRVEAIASHYWTLFESLIRAG